MSLIREYLLLKSPPESQKSTWHDELCLELLWLWRLNSFFDEADTTSPSFGDQHLFTGPVGQCQGAIGEFGVLTFALSRTVGTSWPLAAEKRNRKRRRKLVRCRCSIHDSTSSFCRFQWSQHDISFLQWSTFVQQSCRPMSGPSVSVCRTNFCSVGTSWPLVAFWTIKKAIKEQKAPRTIAVVSTISPAPFATLSFCFNSHCWRCLAAVFWTIEKVASATEPVSERNLSGLAG